MKFNFRDGGEDYEANGFYLVQKIKHLQRKQNRAIRQSLTTIKSRDIYIRNRALLKVTIVPSYAQAYFVISKWKLNCSQNITRGKDLDIAA